MQAWISAVCSLAAAQPLAFRRRRVQPTKNCWGQSVVSRDTVMVTATGQEQAEGRV